MGVFGKKNGKPEDVLAKAAPVVEEIGEELIDQVSGGSVSVTGYAPPDKRVKLTPYDRETIEGAGKDK